MDRFNRLAGYLLIIGLLLGQPTVGSAEAFDAVAREARVIQAEWAGVFYQTPRSGQVARYQELLERIRALAQRHPKRAEPLIVEAIILCALSAADVGLDSLDQLERARSLLEQAIAMDAKALEGAAPVTLGNLYYRVPGWPVLFGDQAAARRYLEMGLKQYPDAIDTNYFYGSYLLGQGHYAESLPYLEKASHAPVRQSLKVSDTRVREEARLAFEHARAGDALPSDFFGLFSPFQDD